VATVLAVDDDRDALEAIRLALEEDGHEVLPVMSGVAALDLLERNRRVDLLLTDIVMPGLNGFNLARMVRMRHHGVRVLYLTGQFEEVIAMRDTGERFGKLLTKPIGPDDLRLEVATALARPAARRAPHRAETPG
jgi:CheY-like chemotaxis protein